MKQGAYVALDMKFINVNKIRVQFKGTSKNDNGIYRIEGDGIETKRNIKAGNDGFKTFLELTTTSSTVEISTSMKMPGGRASIAQIKSTTKFSWSQLLNLNATDMSVFDQHDGL